MKLSISGSTTVDTNPAVERFFYEVAGTVVGEGTITISVADFWDDTGAAATALPVLTTDNSYFTVYINGVLQMQSLLSYTPGGTGTGQLVITVPAGSTVTADSPVVLVVTNYAPDASTDIVT